MLYVSRKAIVGMDCSDLDDGTLQPVQNGKKNQTTEDDEMIWDGSKSFMDADQFGIFELDPCLCQQMISMSIWLNIEIYSIVKITVVRQWSWDLQK